MRVIVKNGHVVETAVQSGEPHLQVPTTSNLKTWRFDDQVIRRVYRDLHL